MSFLRRSGRINPNLNSNQKMNMNMNLNMNMNRPMNMNMGMSKPNPYGGYNMGQNQFHRQEQEKLFHRQRYFNRPSPQRPRKEIQEEIKKEPIPPVIETPEPDPPKEVITIKESSPETPMDTNNETPTPEPAPDTSATTKALTKLEAEDGEAKKKKKAAKIPLSLRRKKLNQRLSKVLAPKSALLLLHELKPTSTYKVQEQAGLNHPLFVASVEDNNVVLGMGQGMSKSMAKNIAAENAIKTIVSKAMTQYKANPEEPMNEESAENLPWAGLASFAMYKMFTEWQSQGTELPLPMPNVVSKPKVSKPAVPKKELPPNAADLHPAVLLNVMNPGLIAQEIQREPGPNGKVTMGYTIDGKTYNGVGRNKKDAKKEAAKAAITGLYGLTYPS